MALYAIDSSIESQLQSKFFSVPVEIRHAILHYFIPISIHVSSDNGRLRLSPCIQRNEDGSPSCLDRKTNEDYFVTKPRVLDPVFVRRLQSLWGSHWRCEEARVGTLEESPMLLFLVCKRMSIDLSEAVAISAAFQCDDVNVLGVLLSEVGNGKAQNGQNMLSVQLKDILSNIRELRINLRVPLAAYTALVASGYSNVESSFLSTWMALPHALKNFERLKVLRIWLDHDQTCSWSLINERAILSPLVPLSSDLDISVDLPKLHPKWERSDWHYMDDEEQLPLRIHRRYRQRLHVVEDGDGSISVKDKSDFPITYECVVWGMTMEEIEEIERREWKAGLDPREVLREIEM